MRNLCQWPGTIGMPITRNSRFYYHVDLLFTILFFSPKNTSIFFRKKIGGCSPQSFDLRIEVFRIPFCKYIYHLTGPYLTFLFVICDLFFALKFTFTITAEGQKSRQTPRPKKRPAANYDPTRFESIHPYTYLPLSAPPPPHQWRCRAARRQGRLSQSAVF